MLPATLSLGAVVHVRVLSDVLGPSATMPRTLHNHLFNQFLDGLPRERMFGDAFVGARHFSRQDGLHLYLAELPPDVKGGERKKSVVQRQLLCVAILPEFPDSFPASRYKRNACCPVRFFWLQPDLSLTSAPVVSRGNRQDSLRVNSYTYTGGRRLLLVHRLLGVTFRCPRELWHLRFTRKLEVDHLSWNHGNNLLLNLLCKRRETHQARPKRKRRA